MKNNGDFVLLKKKVSIIIDIVVCQNTGGKGCLTRKRLEEQFQNKEK